MTQLFPLPKPIECALANDEIFIRALFERPTSLSALLPYDEYVPESGLFVNKDGSLGAVFEATLLEHEPMTSKEIIAAVDGLKTLFNVPSCCALQVLFDQARLSSLDDRFIKLEKQHSDGNPVSQTLFKARLNSLKEACNGENTLSPFIRRAYVSLRYFPLNSLKHSSRLLKRSESILFHEMKGFVEESRRFREIATNFRLNSKLPLRELTAAELLDVLRRFFNPKTYYKRSFAPYNPSLPISSQVLYNSPVLSYLGIEREGIKTRTLSLKTSPQYAYPGGMAYFLKLPFPFKLALNFKFPTRSQSKAFFDMKEFFLQNTPSARAKRQREEVLEVQDKLAHDDSCLQLTFNVIIEGETEEILDSRVREVVNIFNNDLQCETILEEHIGLGLCLNALPLNYSPRADHSTQRNIRILRSDAVNFLPVFDSFRGLKRPLQLFLSRENNLVPFCLLENETSNHTVVLADSGSGKSAFIIDCMQAMKRLNPEPLVFVIDKKSSYTMISEYFKGDLTIFDCTQDMPFTPFRGVYDEEKISFLTNLFLCAIKLTSPTYNVESVHQSAISKALKLAYDKKLKQAGLAYVEGELLKQSLDTQAELQMDDFIAELARLPSEKEFEKFNNTVEDLLRLLMPFYGDGPYARYFKGSATKKEKNASLYIYDLDALDSDPTLQALMTMSVAEEIRQIIKRPENKGREGLIIIEEIGMLGRNNPTASQFIIDFAETMRKLGYWLISLTPRPQNYFELEAGKAMWGVADNFLFLQMSADNVDYLMKHSSLLDEANQEIIKSLRTKRGQYAEVFYMNKKKSRQGAFRYFQSPLDRWLAPTNTKDNAEAAKALKKFTDKWQALTYLAETFPNGVQNEEVASAKN